MNEFYTILKEETAEIIEKRSRFIANIYNITNSEDAEKKIKEIKKKYQVARHNCIAYRVIENDRVIEKSSDDGEPSGTAGGPILKILQKSNLCNVLVVVTRYFGGVLLGTGGLVRAYSDATQEAIKKCKINLMVKGIQIELTIHYNDFEIFKHYCTNNNIKIVNIEYSEDIILKIEMEKNRKQEIMNYIETKRLKVKNINEIQEKYINETVEK